MKKRNFFKRLVSPTPKKWKNIAKTSAALALVFTSAYGAVTVLSITMPEWFSVYVGWIIFAFTLIAGYAQQHEIKPE